LQEVKQTKSEDRIIKERQVLIFVYCLTSIFSPVSMV
jgi:hypothetical protein